MSRGNSARCMICDNINTRIGLSVRQSDIQR